MARRLLPLLDRVLIEKVAAPAKTKTGILLPESAVKQVRNSKSFDLSCILALDQ